MRKGILDELYSRILEEGRGLSETAILRDFFKIETANEEVASRILRPLLKGDSRFRRAPDRTWTAVKTAGPDELPISEASFALFAFDEPGADAFGRNPPSPPAEGSSFVVYKNGLVLPGVGVRQALRTPNEYVFVPHDAKSLALLKRAFREISPLPADLRTLSIKNLVGLLFPEKRLKTWDDIAGEFSIVNLQSDGPAGRVLTLKAILEFLLGILESRGMRTLGDLFAFQERALKKVDFSRYGFDREFLRDIPAMPGVYLFRDKAGRVVYAGKAGNLRVRINSYFWNTGESVEKIEGILERLHRIEYRVLGSDLEAMIEEYRLIDEHKPPFNTKLRVPERALQVPERVLVLPSSMQGMLKLYVLSNSLPLQEIDFDCAGAADEPLLGLLSAVMTGKEGAAAPETGPGAPPKPLFDPAKVIALLYLKRYDRNLNSIDLDRYGTPQEVLAALRRHCENTDALSREKTTYIG